jgi:hypothetical protein
VNKYALEVLEICAFEYAYSCLLDVIKHKHVAEARWKRRRRFLRTNRFGMRGLTTVLVPLDDGKEPETKIGVGYRALADSFILLVKPMFVLYIPPLCGDRRQVYRFICAEGTFRLQVYQQRSHLDDRSCLSNI